MVNLEMVKSNKQLVGWPPNNSTGGSGQNIDIYKYNFGAYSKEKNNVYIIATNYDFSLFPDDNFVIVKYLSYKNNYFLFFTCTKNNKYIKILKKL